MWSVIGTGLSLLGTLFGYYVTGKKNQSDLKKAADAFAAAKGGGVNPAAEDRTDIQNQQNRLKDEEK